MLRKDILFIPIYNISCVVKLITLLQNHYVELSRQMFLMEKIFYLISDPSQNIPEADNNWIENLKNKEIICSCGNVISSSPIDIS